MASAGAHTFRRKLALALLAGFVLWVAWKAVTWPRVADLARKNPPTTAFIERWRRDRRSAGKSDRPDWRWVPYGSISESVKRAVVVSEDIAFFDHHGFDVAEMKAAVGKAFEDRRALRGASTITQQVAKNLWLSPSRNPIRKVEEAILTRQLERDLGKKRILEIYLNVVEMGDGIYGVEAASMRYFGRHASDLDDDQAAQLAACLPNPREWHPGSGSKYARWRTEHVLRLMRTWPRNPF